MPAERKANLVCPECGANIPSGRVERHIKSVHGPEGEAKRNKRAQEREAKKIAGEAIVECEICHEKMAKKLKKSHKKKVHGIGIPLILISRRGVRVNTEKICVGCKKLKSETWFYKESSKGSVYLCRFCKPRFFDKSFGKKDALDFCSLGGGFESNRRKH